MRDVEQRIAERADMRRLQAGKIAARHHHVLDLRVRADVVERGVNQFCALVTLSFCDQRRVLPDRIAARAVLAVDRADRSHKEEHLIGIAVHEAR